MSATPLRPTSSAGWSTRRVFSPEVREVLDVLEKHRSTPLHPSRVTECSEETAQNNVNAEVPSTTSHRTRLNAHSGSARNSPHCRPSTAGSAATTAATFTATTTTKTLEFSLKDIPLDGKVASPVWREPSSRRSHSSRRPSPARGDSTASPARLSYANTMAADVPSPANMSCNPYADAARDSTNMLRRQRVVRTFFDSHEDAVRLYIRLQQLLSFRDLCQRDVQRRLQYMNSDEERQRAAAARAQRMAAQEQEIQRVQAALARADMSSPEFASSMNLLHSTQSGTPTEKSAKRDGEMKTRVNPFTGRGTAAVHASSKAASNDSPRSAPRPGSNTKGKETGAGRGGQRDRPVAAARPTPFLRHATPKAALEAWRGSRSQEMLPPSPSSPASASLHDGADGTPRHRGFTPNDIVPASNVAPPPPSAVGAGAAIVTLMPVVQDAPPQPTPRQVAPLGNSISSVVHLRAAPDALVRSSVSAQPSFSSSLLPTTAQSGVGDAAKAVVRPVETRTTRAAALPPAPASSPGVVGVFVTPPRSARTARQPTALSPSRTTPKRYAAGPSPSSTDSPLARFRKQQGYEDPAQHYLERLSDSTAPLRSISSMGSARRSPPPPPLPAQHGKSFLEEDVAAAAPSEPAEDKTTVAPASASPMPVGRGTALLRSAEAAFPSRRTALPLETAKKPIMESTRGPSVPRSPSSSPLSPERRAAILQRASQRRASLSTAASVERAIKASGARPLAAAAAAAATPGDIRSWSPATPPEHGIPSHNGCGGSSSSSDIRRSATIHAGLVSSTAKSLRSSREAPLHDAAPQSLCGTSYASANVAALASTSAGHSVWDDIAALERRVGGLEGRAAELERNAAKRAVLDAIRLLRERVALLEDRTTVLERGSGDGVGEGVAGALQWRRS